MSESQLKRGVTFSYAMRSFTGYLRGTEKAEHTIASYQSDLRLFERFVLQRLSRKPVTISQLGVSDLRRYAEYLRSQGFHDNTRRRRLLTVRRLFQYLQKRGRLELDLARRIPAPHKIEKVPRVVDAGLLLKKVRELPVDSLLECRNRVLLWTLLETGVLVSEASGLQAEHFDAQSCVLHVPGKGVRSIPVSLDLVIAVGDLQKRNRGSRYLFQGCNRHGPISGTAITPRGIEMLVKSHRPILGKVTPRTLRHSVVIEWAKGGHDQEKIRGWLGLKTDYAFRAYAPLLRGLKSSP
jgi:integrase/recombinase XerC